MTQKVEWGPVAWVEQLVPHSAGASVLTVAGDPSIGMVYPATFASRSSDGGGIGVITIAHQDIRADAGGVWSIYPEVHIAQDAHANATGFCIECAVINKRASVGDVNPYQISNWGMVDGVRIGVGKPGDNGQEISSLMTFTNVENSATAIARKGLVFAANVLKFFGGIANAVNFAMGHAIRWFDQYGRPGPVIYAEAGGNSDYASGIKFTNGAIHFTDAAGVHQFSFNTMTGALYLGTGSIGPNGTIRVFVGGVPYLLTARKE